MSFFNDKLKHVTRRLNGPPIRDTSIPNRLISCVACTPLIVIHGTSLEHSLRQIIPFVDKFIGWIPGVKVGIGRIRGMDGSEIGGITIGGMSIGGITMGGMSIGGTTITTGPTKGTSISIGGITIGGNTIGGSSIGGKSIGGITISPKSIVRRVSPNVVGGEKVVDAHGAS